MERLPQQHKRPSRRSGKASRTCLLVSWCKYVHRPEDEGKYCEEWLAGMMEAKWECPVVDNEDAEWTVYELILSRKCWRNQGNKPELFGRLVASFLWISFVAGCGSFFWSLE